MKNFKLLLKQFFNNSFFMVPITFLSIPGFIGEDEPTFFQYFCIIFSTSFLIILVVSDIITFRKTLKKLKED